MKKLIITLTVTALLITFNACKKEENPNLFSNQQLMELMNDFYLWYDKLPNVKAENYPSPIELMQALRYQPLDKWSYVTTKKEIEDYYGSGTYIGYGIGLAFDTQSRLWLTFVLNDSPFRQIGVNRGWRISAINSTIPTPNNINSLLSTSAATFTLVNPDEQTSSHSISKRVIVMNSIIADTVYSSNKIGYFVLNSFIEPTINELSTLFNQFKSEGVKDLIVDLRYNGGGSIITASHLANLIAGVTANEKVLATYSHNNKQESRDESILISLNDNSLEISRVVFITSKSTASASELIINGLKPHMGVTLVGDDTYGKPVGMYVFTSPSYKWAFVPISFRMINANGEGDYYNGLPVDIEANDGINIPFGDTKEPSLAAAIGHLEEGVGLKKSSSTQKVIYPKLKGLQGEIGAW
jgi:carboxyl-terminal processing protease